MSDSSSTVPETQGPSSPQPQPTKNGAIEEPRASPPFVGTVESNSSTSSRAELLAKARAFLASSHVQHQDVTAKRGFLKEKGLLEPEIDQLLTTTLIQPPSVPPRTYPLPPPSNLPMLLLALARLLSWLAGGSAILILIYHRFLLPRIAQTGLARQSLKSHHVSLLRRLTTSLAALKERQAESFSVLPRHDPWTEAKPFSKCNSVEDILDILGNEEPDITRIPPVTLLRCGIADFSKGQTNDDAKPTTEDLFRYLEGQIPWLAGEEALPYEEKLWEALSTTTLFKRIIPSSSHPNENAKARWDFIAPPLKKDPPIISALNSLSSAMPRGMKHRAGPFQHTLQSLSELTGYLSTQVYLPYRPLNTQNNVSSTEEDIKREIKALKGLVLNRRTFMPTVPRNISNTTSHNGS